ncbi:protein-(glutamine-N5) methyltransferase, release factor-specific [Synechococcus sp. PCC 7502]|uniref:peptide chain release factor N(5)-glutamine methyltransferase n=1 Tax=Synechococcus sp. PCC 7502 TaxID=1173263 RepID=UPI00029F8299|nr:peptide chain release factor N(5)-glutamine methyltransferase [Synechococcus sp. PCC 7502]AFY74542.1 protein-(glutamine-N5) methyltransferase, release factor-specific [Synechococcus sp. PCC 7502]
MNFGQWYRRSEVEAKSHNISGAELDWLVLGMTGAERLHLKLGTLELDQSQVVKLDQMWQQRIIAKTPIQYLIGKTHWRNLELVVNADVLIPRPETEILIDLVLDQSDPNSAAIWVDLGTGSGAIAIGLALELKNSQVYAVDYSHGALAIAQRNADKYPLEIPIQFYQGFWFEPLDHLKSQITGMISNPPYIPTVEVKQLEPEVCNHEPHLALDGGTDGLDCIRYLIQTAPEYLIRGGHWLIEVMAGQAQTVRSLLEINGNYQNIQIHLDHNGIERFVSALKI